MILSRLRDYLLYLDMSFNKFEISLGVSHGSISNAWKRKKNIGSNVVERILITYPEVSAEWLLRGEGNMLKTHDASELNQEVSIDKDFNEQLISQMLNFFNLKSKRELKVFLTNSLSTGAIISLEQMILSTWENKYGQELKNIKRQLMTLFTSQLDYELKSEKRNSNSKIS